LQLALALVVCGMAAAGCKSGSWSRYVSPRVTGRVVDWETRQPIQDVKVRRLSADESYRTLEPPKGGQLLEQGPFVMSGKDGLFDLASVRSLSPFRKTRWYSVSVCFEHAGYQRFSTSYVLAEATNTPSGEPLVQAGDVPLAPLAK